MKLRISGARRRGEQGAAAVEFALVSVILVLIMFGILQYGLFFNDSLSARQGVREAARMGVVENISTSACNPAQTDRSRLLACTTRTQMAPTTGTAYAKVSTPDGWGRGKRLIVCGAVKESTVGYLPMPNDNWIYTKTQMSIEQENEKANWPATTYADTAAGLDWTRGDC